MRKYSAVCGMILGFIFVGVIQARSSSNCPEGFSTAVNAHLFQAQSPSHTEQYRLIKSTKGLSTEETTFDSATYESSNGTRILVRKEFLHSENAMKARMAATLKAFSEIIEQSEDKTRPIPMGRIVCKRAAGEPANTTYAIVWNENYNIKYLESSSLEVLLDFEKRFYKSRK